MSPSLFQVLHISSDDMNSRIKDLGNSSNNLSNVNTVGFKQSRVNFQELLDGATRSGSKSSSTQVLTGQGNIITTEIPTDLSINGSGFFGVTLSDGTLAYTRDGSLIVDSEGTLLSSSGYPIIWNGEIPSNYTEVAISAYGEVTAKVGNDWVQAGTINLYNFKNPGALLNKGSNLWVESNNSGKAVTGKSGDKGFGTIVAGTLESSNVDLSSEFTHIITIQRSFQLASQAFKKTDDMIDGAIRLRKV